MLIAILLLTACLVEQNECDTDSLDSSSPCEEVKFMGPNLPPSPK